MLQPSPTDAPDSFAWSTTALTSTRVYWALKEARLASTELPYTWDERMGC